MNESLPELFQFRYSMYPEMARWAMDHKGIPHVRQSVIPGPHAPKLIKLAGQTSMPVLRHQGQIIKDSDAVLDYIEATWPEKPLYPDDPDQRARAIEIRDRFRDWGPDIRRAFFNALIPYPDYAAALFSQDCPEAQQKKYRRGFFFVKLIMRSSMKITPKRAAASAEVTAEALDWLAANINEHGYLVGEQFSVADLTAATVMCCCSLTEGTNAAAPEPRPERLQAWVDRWADHPATIWANRMYSEHRPPSAAIEDRDY